jgi:hypothetical protein
MRKKDIFHEKKSMSSHTTLVKKTEPTLCQKIRHSFFLISRRLNYLSLFNLLMLFFVFSKVQAGEKHAMGFIPENPEKYASIPEVSRYRAYFPPETDLSKYFPKPGDQGKQGSCVAWATAYAARSYLEARRQGSNPHTPDQIFSPAFIFNQVKVGNCEDGGSISDALGILKNTGVASLADFPYVEGSCSRLPDAKVLSEAAPFRIKNWKKVDTEQLDDVKGQIYAGNPVIFGMFVSRAFENLKKNQLYDDISSDRTGGHAMVLVGYSEPKQAFKLINSWGDTWGDEGFGWISYRAFKKWAQNAFIMQLSSAPGPLPHSTSADIAPEAETIPEINPTPKPITPTPIPHPVWISPALPEIMPDSNAELKQTVSSLIHTAKCADLQGSVTSDGLVRLTGFVGEQQDLNHIVRELKKIGASVSINTTLRPWPQCEALLTLRDVLAKPTGLKISVSGHSPALLSDGDKLYIDVTTPDFPSYLYLTYIQTNGEAIYLLRPQGHPPRPLAPNSHLLLGNGEGGGPKFMIRPPFGEEMIVAIAAAKPLFAGDLPNSQTEREYLTRFRQAFLSAPESKINTRIVAASMTTLTTRAKH